MNLKPHTLMVSLLCTLLSGITTAGDQNDKNGLSLDEAVAEVRAQTGGRILSAKTANDNGGRIHHIRVLTKEGKVQRFQIEARQKKEPAPHKGRR